jgi:transcriptional regulator with XRE-family HTH domain
MAKPNLREILAENMRSYRQRNNVSQDEFAHRSGLHRTYVGSVERCERNVTLSTLEMLSSATGMSVPSLLSKGGTR